MNTGKRRANWYKHFAILVASSALGLTACAGPPSSATSAPATFARPSAAESPTFSTPSDPTSSSVSPSPLAAANIDKGPVNSSPVLDVETFDGYKASFSFAWHAPRVLVPADFANFNGCITPPDLEQMFNSQNIVRGVFVEGSATFLTTKGFAWPAATGVSVTASTGGFVCAEKAGDYAMDPSMNVITPSNPTFSYLFYDIGQKTPNAPDGSFKSGPGGTLSLSGSSGDVGLNCSKGGSAVLSCATSG